MSKMVYIILNAVIRSLGTSALACDESAI